MNSSLNLFDYEKVGPEILQNCKIERKMASKSGLEKHTSEAAYMIRLTFVYILYSQFVIVCMYNKHTKVVSVSQLYRFCIVCSYLNYLYVQETYKGCFSLASTGVLVIARFYIKLVYYLYVQETFKVLQLQFLHFLYKYVQEFDVHFLYIHLYKIYTKLVFCIIFVASQLAIHFVQFLYNFFGEGSVTYQ